MNNNPNRYIAEIEIPEGLVTIDCEIEFLENNTDQTQIRFLLSNQTYEIPNNPRPQGGLTLREELESDLKAIRTTDRKDISEVIQEHLQEAYGEEADITVSSIDMD